MQHGLCLRLCRVTQACLTEPERQQCRRCRYRRDSRGAGLWKLTPHFFPAMLVELNVWGIARRRTRSLDSSTVDTETIRKTRDRASRLSLRRQRFQPTHSPRCEDSDPTPWVLDSKAALCSGAGAATTDGRSQMGSDIAHVKASIKSAPRAISKPESVPGMNRQDRGEVFENWSNSADCYHWFGSSPLLLDSLYP
jgi:hypothetical protein